MYNIHPDEEKMNKMSEFISGVDRVDIKNLIWALGKLEERITAIEDLLMKS